MVLPFAIERTVLVGWSRRDDTRIRAHSLDYGDRIDIVLGSVPSTERAAGAGAGWTKYVEGVARALATDGYAIYGIDLMIAGDVPQGAGLSSSAALEVAVAGAFRDAFALLISDVDLAVLCHRAENEYVGVQSGIMDQFASALCREDNALLIDCRSLARRDIPLRPAARGLSIVIANSGVQRELAASAYNDRRRECDEAIAELRRILSRPDLTSLRDVTFAEIESLDITDATSDTALRRARHVVTEISRVACAVDALDRDDFDELGRLMRESHQSLREDYDVSSAQLDLLCALADAQDYVLGSRLTGAGFGGCTIHLVRTDSVDAFTRDVIAPYRTQSSLPAETYTTAPRDGLRTYRP